MTDTADTRDSLGRPGGPAGSRRHPRQHDRRVPTRRPVHHGRRPGRDEQHPGAGAAARRAAPPRPCGRAEHRGAAVRLPRLTAGRLRPRGGAHAAPAPGPAVGPPPRGQRGARRLRGDGLAAGRLPPGRPLRRRPRHLVRQGPRPGPRHRRDPSRRVRRHDPARRRGRAGRRRPRRQVEHHAQQQRRRPGRPPHADPLPGHPGGVPGARPARRRDQPCLRALGGHEDRHPRRRRGGNGRPARPHRRPGHAGGLGRRRAAPVRGVPGLRADDRGGEGVPHPPARTWPTATAS